MRSTYRRLFVLGLIIGLVGMPAAGYMASWLTSPVQQSGSVTYGAGDGPSMTISGDTSFSGTQLFPRQSTVQYVSDAGNITASGAENTAFNVSASELKADTVRYTGINATAGEVTISHETHQDLSLDGGVNWFEHRQVDVDDGSADLEYSASSGTTVTLRGLPSGEMIGFVDTDQGNVLAAASTGETGIATATLPDGEHTVELQTSEGNTVLSNPSPVGDLEHPPTQLSVQLNDSDYPTDSHTVDFYLDGSQIASKSANQNKTVSASVPDYENLTAGSHTWRVEATDNYGNFREQRHSFRVPDQLVVRNETNPDQIINNTTVNIQFFASDTVVNRETENGTVSLEGLPVGERLIVSADADEYNERTTVLESLYQQQSVYLLPNNTSSVEIRFVLEDTTGEFPSDSVLYVEKPLTQNGSTNYRTVVSDEFGAQGVTTWLEEGERYQLRIESPDGEVAMLGKYTPTTPETVELRPDTASVNLSSPYESIGYDAYRDGDNLKVEYSDPDSQTDYLSVTVFERNNESNILRHEQTYYDLGNISLSEPLDAAERNTTWVVVLSGERRGEEISARIVVGDGPRDLIPSELDGVWRISIGVFLLLTSSLIFSQLNVGVGAVTTAITGGVLWYIGLLDGVATGASVTLAIMVSVIYSAVYRR